MRAIDTYSGSSYRYDGKIRPRTDALYATGADPEAINWPHAFRAGGRTGDGETIMVATGLIEVVEIVASMNLSGPEALTLAQVIEENDPDDDSEDILIASVQRLVRLNLIADSTKFAVEVTYSTTGQVGHSVYVQVLALRASNAGTS